jgi:L-fucose isomerase-like protein
MQITEPFGYLVEASTLHDRATIDGITSRLRSRLDELGGVRLEAPDDLVDAPLAILVATGGTEESILRQVRRRRAVRPFEPVLLGVHRAHNSLPAALEALARLQAEGVRGRIVQVDADDTLAITRSVADVRAIHRLHHSRLGQVGGPSPWLVASVPDPELLRRRWGIELVSIDIAETIAAHRTTDRDRGRPVAVRYASGTAASSDLLEAAALHPVLDEAAQHAGVDAITVRCFDYLGELGTSGCVALAELNDTGFVAGCEGDVASAVAMLLVRLLLDQPSWIANPAAIDELHDRLLLAHCTVAPSLVEQVELHTHFESGIGVGLRGRFAPGPATLLRLGGPALDRIWVSDAMIEESGADDDLCRTQVTLRLIDVPARSLLDAPLGNHLVLALGHHRQRFERWWQLAFG